METGLLPRLLLVEDLRTFWNATDDMACGVSQGLSGGMQIDGREKKNPICNTWDNNR